MSDETIAVRAYTVPKKPDSYGSGNGFAYQHIVFERILVWDTETSTKLHQSIKFGYFKIFQYEKLESHGLFYDSITVKGTELATIQKYSQTNNITLYTLVQFRKIFLHECYDLESLCIGFNLFFDISRIVIKSSNAKFKRKGGFSLQITKNQNYPRLHITHISNALSFIEWGNPRFNSENFKGNFLDLRTLCYALTDKKHTLESACKAFKTGQQKISVKKHGKITTDYIKYCILDVDSTYSLYHNTKKEFDTYNLDIPITRAYTPATIGKQFLKQIGIKPFFEKNKKFPLDIVGYVMTCYIGGKVECKIRKTPTLLDVLDFLSMYPTVCTLQNLWSFVIAKRIIHKDATKEIQELIDNFTINQVQDKALWEKFTCIVQIIPDEDVLPIRAQFGDKHSWNIGTCTVSGTEPMWYGLADVLHSKLSTGKTPKILRAIKFVPQGIQENLKCIEFQGITIDPYGGDLFKNLIEYRQELKQKQDSFQKDTSEYQYYGRKQLVIKIITNAISYGIFVEINTLEESEKIPIDVYGLRHFEDKKIKSEQTGYMFNPIIAVSITSSARLLLGATEVLLNKHNATHAYCDTDSMMIPPQYTKEIQEFFQPLNPYNFDADIFKLEYPKKWFYGISSKRYCLYDIVEGNIVINDEKYSAHGLGHLLDPFKNESDEKSTWHKDFWKDIIDLHYDNITHEFLVEKYSNKYAIQQLTTSTPNMVNRFKKFNLGKDYPSQIKPANFAILGFSNKMSPYTGELIKPFAPYCNPAKHVVYGKFIDYNDPKQREFQGKEYWKSLWDTMEEYLRHLESKFDGDVGILKRKHVRITSIVHIGKESNGLDESELLGLDEDSYVEYSDVDSLERKFRELAPKILELKPKDVRKFEISKQTLWNAVNKINNNQFHRISKIMKIKFIGIYL